MANYCQTSITFVSKDRKMLKCFWKVLRDELLKAHPCKVVDVMKAFGYKNNLILNKMRVDNRDMLKDMDIYIKGENGYDCYFSVRTETACGPHVDPWLILLKRRFGGKIQLYYLSEGLESGIFQSNDGLNAYYPVQYVIEYDIRGTMKGKKYFHNISDLKKYLERKFKLDTGDTCNVEVLKKLVARHMGLTDDGYVNIVEVDYDTDTAVA